MPSASERKPLISRANFLTSFRMAIYRFQWRSPRSDMARSAPSGWFAQRAALPMRYEHRELAANDYRSENREGTRISWVLVPADRSGEPEPLPCARLLQSGARAQGNGTAQSYSA